METSLRNSSSLDYSGLSTKDLVHEYYSIKNPWMDKIFIQDTDSKLDIIIKIAVAIITLTGSLWIAALHDNYFHELSDRDIEALDAIEEEIDVQGIAQREEERFWNDMQLDPTLVKREFSQIDRQSLMAKLLPIFGNPTDTSLIGRQILKCKSYDEAINLLAHNSQRFSYEEFYAIVGAIKSELYSEVK